MSDDRPVTGARCAAPTAAGDVTLCHAAFVLAGGQIEAQVANRMATRFTAAITGGTGIYEGVTGQIRNVVSAPGVIDQTFYLIRPQLTRRRDPVAPKRQRTRRSSS